VPQQAATFFAEAKAAAGACWPHFVGLLQMVAPLWWNRHFCD
jgi:hypothetical protein